MLKFSMELCYPQLDVKTLSVGTLGPKETSSEQTLNYLISQWKLQQISVNSHLFDSFTDLKESLLENQIDLALVPHAYERINDFYMEPSFKLGFIFTYPTPVYGLAKRKNEEIVVENKIEEPEEIPTIEVEVIEEPAIEIKEEPIAVIEEPIIEGNISFKNVSFTYPDTGIEALKNVSFELKKGQFLAIIGRTGSGKSTLANLIMRMYDTDSGKIEIDGNELRNINLNNYRSQIGFVPQEVFLFSDTIKNNIAFGLSEIEEGQVENAAKNAAVYHNIIDFDLKFETMLGERGITLSGGQKQRVSIARALIKEPKVLIFDDCLSAVDTKTEEEILGNLGKIMNGKTSILIAHRISTIKNADKIIVLDEGQIIEQGTHNELLNKGGAYTELYNNQLLEEENV